jgi:NADPH:quinone reductase-like Zn-dependent oxidoreductase
MSAGAPGKTMQAIWIERHGPPSDLRVSDVPVPTAGPSEALVEIEAAGVNPSDTVSAEGRFPDSRLPRILGRDFAGTVVGGAPELIGRRVWGSGGDLGITRDGTHAEYVALPAAAVAIRPSNLTPEEAAATGVPFQTAWCALIEKGDLRAGERVIVSGAAGAVGSAAVQIASSRGARVVALVKDASEEAAVDHTKVDAVARSDRGDLTAIVKQATDGRGADLAFNVVGAAIFQQLVDALAEGGRMVLISAAGGREVTLDLMDLYRRELRLIGLNTAFIDAVRGAEIMNAMAPLFETGALGPPRITARLPLSKAAEAYALISSGKVVLVPDRLYHPSN